MTIEPRNAPPQPHKILSAMVIAASILFLVDWLIGAAMLMSPFFKSSQNLLPYLILFRQQPQTFVFLLLVKPLATIVALYFGIRGRAARAILILAATEILGTIVSVAGSYLMRGHSNLELAPVQFILSTVLTVATLAALVLSYRGRNLIAAAAILLVIVACHLSSTIYVIFLMRGLFP